MARHGLDPGHDRVSEASRLPGMERRDASAKPGRTRCGESIVVDSPPPASQRSNVVMVVPDPAPPWVPPPLKDPVKVWLDEPLITRTT